MDLVLRVNYITEKTVLMPVRNRPVTDFYQKIMYNTSKREQVPLIHTDYSPLCSIKCFVEKFVFIDII